MVSTLALSLVVENGLSRNYFINKSEAKRKKLHPDALIYVMASLASSTINGTMVEGQ